MLRLVCKDILIQKKTVSILLLYVLLMMFLFQGSGSANSILVGFVTAITYTMAMTSFAYDEKNKAEIMLNSLPISRWMIVLARYLSLFIFALINVTVFWAATMVTKAMGLFPTVLVLNIETALTFLVSIGLLCAIYFPIFFKVGYIKAKTFNFILFFMIFIGIFGLRDFMTARTPSPWLAKSLIFLANQSELYIGLMVVCGTMLLLTGSYLLSVRFYAKREF